MSKHPPGSPEWWGETALIAAGGLMLAWMLWDGPIIGHREVYTNAPGIRDLPPNTVTSLIGQGCITAEHLQALREGRNMQVSCPEPDAPTVILRDLPPENRPFP